MAPKIMQSGWKMMISKREKNQILQQIRPDYRIGEVSGLQQALLECYEKVYMEIGMELGRYYRTAVYKGLLIWAGQPERVGRSALMDDLILEIFDQLMDEKYANMVSNHFERLENIAAEAIRSELLREGWDPERVRTLARIPLKAFRQYWMAHAKVFIREEVEMMVEEFNFWELLEDLPQMPRESRIKMRSDHVARLWQPLRRQLLEDRVKLSLRILGAFQEQIFTALYCDQLILSLGRWENTVAQTE